MPGKNLQITLTFKPIFDGLNRFTSAITDRMAKVQAFNKTIENGASAVNTALAQAAAFLGARALSSYVDKAEEAERAQKQLVAALQKQGQYSAEYVAQLNEQGDALESVTKFESEQVSAVQRQLVSYRVSRKEIGALTESVLDLAQALGVGAEGAAVLIGKTLRGDQEELGRYGIVIDQTKDRVTALREAIQRFAGGQARAAVVFPELRQFSVQIDQLQKDLGRSVASVLAPLAEGAVVALQKLGDRLQRLLVWVRDLGPQGRQNLKQLGEFLTEAAVAATTVLGPLLAIKGLLAALAVVINPLRSAFVFIAGMSFASAVGSLAGFVGQWGALAPFALKTPNWFQAILDKGEAVFRLLSFKISGATASAGAFAASWPKVSAGLTMVAQSLGVLALAAAAFWAGWKLGEMLNELEVGGAQVKDWAAAIVGQLMAWGVEAWGAVRTGWANIAFAFSEFIPAIKVTVLEFLVWLGDKFNNTLGEKLGFKIPTDGLKQSLGEAQRALQKAADEHTEKLRKIDAETKATAAGFSEAGLDILAQGKAATAAKSTRSTTAPIVNGEPDNGPAIKTREQRARELEEAKAAIALDRLQNEQAYDQKIIDLEAYLANRDALMQRAIAAEKKLSDTPPGRAATALLLAQEADEQAKLRKETAEKEKQFTQAGLEYQLAHDRQKIEQSLAEIENDRYLTTEQKQARILPLLQQENDKLAERIKLIDDALRKEADPAKRLDLLKSRDDLSGQSVAIDGKIAAAQPQSFGDGMRQGVSGQGGFLDSLGTSAQNAAAAVSGTLNAALQGTSDILYNLATGAMNFRQAWSAATLQVGQQFLRMVTDMVAKMIWRATVERALIALGVVTHVAGEGAKTTATVAGSGIRLGSTIKEALAEVYAGAVGAYRSLVSIPYVGPILGAAAMAAALAGGLALVSKIGHADGGLITGPGTSTSDSIPAMLSDGEFVVREQATSKFGPSFLHDLNSGVLNLGALPDGVAMSMARPTQGGGAATGAGAASEAGGGDQTQQMSAQDLVRGLMENIGDRITVVVANSDVEATRIARHSRARSDIVRIMKEERGQIFRQGP